METVYLTGGKETTKSVILRILTAEWPLSIKKIYFSVLRGHNRSVTYQAVYKSIKELLAEGVLSRQEEGYMISPLWIEKASEFIGKLAEAYEKTGVGTSRKIQELNFSSWSEAWDFLLSKMSTNFFGESKEAYVQLRRFFLIPISRDDLDRLKTFFSIKGVYIMCRANSTVDKMAAHYLSSMGAHVITGVECARPTSVIVYGNCIVSIYVTGEKDRMKLAEYYKKTKDMKSPKPNLFESFSNLLYSRMRVKLIINRDPEVLSDVLEQTKAILSKRPY